MDEINNFTMKYHTEKAVDTFGEISQIEQAVEEFAEFTVAVNHYKRKREQSQQELLEEMCDCIIMAKQLEYIASKKYGQEFDDAMSYKLSKLDKAIRDAEDTKPVPIWRREPRSVHQQLLLTPYVKQALNDRAQQEGVSINEIAARAFETYLFENAVESKRQVVNE